MSEFKRLEHLKPNLDKMVEIIRGSNKVLVTMHRRPDGDAAGSAIAMYHMLHALGKEAVIFNVDPIPDNFTFLNGAQDIVSEIDIWDFDLCIVLDCGDPSLLGKSFPFDKLKCPIAFIDHHSIPYQNCLINLHDSQASAVGEILFHLARALNVEITQDIAAALYTSIITDTGSYRYTSTTPDSMMVSSYLLATGFDVWDVASNIYENNPVEKVKLLALVLRTLWLSDDGKLASLYANRQMLRQCHCSGAMTDGFINYARSIRGVEVSIFLTELDKNLYRVSFRSRGNLDVSLIASQFGGGGHKNAAACTQSGTIEEIRDRIVNVLKEKLL